MKQKFIKAVLIALTFAASHAQAQGTYLGRFTYFGGDTGGSTSRDLRLAAPTFVSQFSIDVSGNCNTNAQILHNSTYPVGPTRLISRTYSPINPGMIRHTFSVNNGAGFAIVGIRGYMSGFPRSVCTGSVYIDSIPAIPPPSQYTSIQGTVVWVNELSTGNGDTSIRVQLDNGQQVEIQIVGSPNALPETQFNFRTVQYVSDLKFHRVQVTGEMSGNGMRATLIQEL